MTQPDRHARPAGLSLLYGKGVFTTIAVRGGECVFWEKHWRRLVSNADVLEIDLSGLAEESISSAIAETLRLDGIVDGRVRVSFLDESTSPLWNLDPVKKTSISIVTGPNRPTLSELRLTVSPHRINSTSPLVGIKSSNYLEPLLSLDEAKRRGFDEAIRLNERGEIASACMANVFWLKGGKLFTPSLKTGCLPGTTREFILENLACEEVEAYADELLAAEAIFLSSAGLGVVRAARFCNIELPTVEHPIISLLPY